MTAIRIRGVGEAMHVEGRWRVNAPGSVVALSLPASNVTLEPREARQLATELERIAESIEAQPKEAT